jgi:DNA-binding MarR family transcriptional regulator
VSVLVRRMEQAGLVERQKKGNYHEYEVKITERARKLASETPRASIEVILSSLSAAEKQTLVACLKKLDDKARHALGLDYSPPF